MMMSQRTTMACVLTVAALMDIALAADDHHDAALELGLVWSSPVLVEGPSPASPQGPPVPDHFYAFDENHFYGPGTNTSWMFTRDGGASWNTTPRGHPANVPHTDAAMLPIASPRALSYQTVGGGWFPAPDAHARGAGWTLQWPRTYTLGRNGSDFVVTAAPGGTGPSHNVTFRGLPYPFANTTAAFKPGVRNYGAVRAGNGHFVLQTDIIWNGVPVPPPFHGTTWAPSSIVSFTSPDGYSWEYGGVIANWSSVPGGPQEWG